MRFIWKRILAPLISFLPNKEHVYLPEDRPIPCIHFGTGALAGFYQVGIAKYIQENYDLSHYDFSGVSAGSYCAALLAYNFTTLEIDDIVMNLIKSADEDHNFWETVNAKITYNTGDIKKLANSNLFIATTKLTPFPKRVFLTNFTSFQEAMEACKVSSHIPFLFGKPFIRYNGSLMCDGGALGDRDLPEERHPVVKINPDFWGREIENVYDWNTAYCLSLYKLGYSDSKSNKDILDLTFKDKYYSIINNGCGDENGTPCSDN